MTSQDYLLYFSEVRENFKKMAEIMRLPSIGLTATFHQLIC